MNRKLTNSDLAGGRDWCIAGGWAACPGLASDQDVWIFVGDGSHDVDERFNNVLKVRRAMLTAFPEIAEENDEVMPETIDDVNAAVERMLHEYGDLGMFIQKVGVIDNRHIMVTDADGVLELLDGFDISTHQCAITSDGLFVKGRNWTSITEPPVAFRSNEHTPARLQKIRERYRL